MHAANLMLALLLLSVPANAGAASWAVDKAHSTVGFTGTASGQAFTGKFQSWDAQIEFDPKSLSTSHVYAEFAVGSTSTGDQTRDEMLPTADWFSAETFPKAIYEARQFKDLGGGRYEAIGTLSIRGIKRDVVLPFQLEIAGEQARMTASLTLDRHSFDLGQGQFASDDMVASAVQVTIDLQATRGA